MSRQPVIDGIEFASGGGRLKGVSRVGEFPRLHDMLASDGGEIAYTINGGRDEQGRPVLQIGVRGTLQLRCQRCLGAIAFDIDLEERLVLAATQAEIDAEPADATGPNRALAAREMPVRDLIEDELILAVPYAPRHESCASHAGSGERERRLPFANLRGLMRKN
jgi:uncharacterized protein